MSETFGRRLRRLRTARKLSRSTLAALLRQEGFTTAPEDIVKYEGDLIVPRVRTFAALAAVLDVTMDALWYGE